MADKKKTAYGFLRGTKSLFSQAVREHPRSASEIASDLLRAGTPVRNVNVVAGVARERDAARKAASEAFKSVKSARDTVTKDYKAAEVLEKKYYEGTQAKVDAASQAADKALAESLTKITEATEKFKKDYPNFSPTWEPTSQERKDALSRAAEIDSLKEAHKNLVQKLETDKTTLGEAIAKEKENIKNEFFGFMTKDGVPKSQAVLDEAREKLGKAHAERRRLESIYDATARSHDKALWRRTSANLEANTPLGGFVNPFMWFTHGATTKEGTAVGVGPLASNITRSFINASDAHPVASALTDRRTLGWPLGGLAVGTYVYKATTGDSKKAEENTASIQTANSAEFGKILAENQILAASGARFVDLSDYLGAVNRYKRDFSADAATALTTTDAAATTAEEFENARKQRFDMLVASPFASQYAYAKMRELYQKDESNPLVYRKAFDRLWTLPDQRSTLQKYATDNLLSSAESDIDKAIFKEYIDGGFGNGQK